VDKIRSEYFSVQHTSFTETEGELQINLRLFKLLTKYFGVRINFKILRTADTYIRYRIFQLFLYRACSKHFYF
jgi:hypothetical protein